MYENQLNLRTENQFTYLYVIPTLTHFIVSSVVSFRSNSNYEIRFDSTFFYWLLSFAQKSRFKESKIEETLI